MCNELYLLYLSLLKAGYTPKEWYKLYKPLPNASEKNPCVKICLSDGEITEISSVNPELVSGLRKYGQTYTFPAMNLVPLYRITTDTDKDIISEVIKTPEIIDEEVMNKINTFCCGANNNWGNNVRKKFNASMSRADDLSSFLQADIPDKLDILITEVKKINFESLHDKLTKFVMNMLKNREDVSLAMRILCHCGDSKQDSEKDCGILSVIFEAEILQEMGTPTVSTTFVSELNDVLLNNMRGNYGSPCEGITDAFGDTWDGHSETMPEVKLAGGITVKLRSMFGKQKYYYCWGAADDDSYPISIENRTKLAAALAWAGSVENKEKIWINTDKGEILFAFPTKLPEVNNISFVRFFKPDFESINLSNFKVQAERFISEINYLKTSSSRECGHNNEGICVFVLRQIDKGRTKIEYSKTISAGEIEKSCELWNLGCETNIPKIRGLKTYTPYPYAIADILNVIWRQDGGAMSESYQPITKYYGLEMILGTTDINRDIRLISRNLVTIAPALSQMLTTGKARGNFRLNYEKGKGKLQNNPVMWARYALPLLGLFLQKQGRKKEQYMQEFPYQLGQLLKITDELHAKYCKIVREDDVPPQLIGSTFFNDACIDPFGVIGRLGNRSRFCIDWAKRYRRQKEEDSGIVGWLLRQHEKISTQIAITGKPGMKFNDTDKSLFALGYFAAIAADKNVSEEIPGDDGADDNAIDESENIEEA